MSRNSPTCQPCLQINTVHKTYRNDNSITKRSFFLQSTVFIYNSNYIILYIKYDLDWSCLGFAIHFCVTLYSPLYRIAKCINGSRRTETPHRPTVSTEAFRGTFHWDGPQGIKSQRASGIQTRRFWSFVGGCVGGWCCPVDQRWTQESSLLVTNITTNVTIVNEWCLRTSSMTASLVFRLSKTLGWFLCFLLGRFT